MKKVIAIVVSPVLYAAGHIASKLLFFDRFAFVYPVYNWLMTSSLAIEEWAGTIVMWKFAVDEDK